MDFERAATVLPAPLIDPYQRAITYLRVSVTDRCDFRCVYCMSEDMTFLPKTELLSLEELDRLCSAFVRLGVRKPLYALIAGREAKEGVSMGHAGALVLGDAGTLASKTQRLTQAGARVFGSIEAIVEACTADFAAIRT